MSDYTILYKKQVELPEVRLLTLKEFRSDRKMVKSFGNSPLGLDFEANTYDYCAEDFYIRTVGLANDDYVVSIDLKGAAESDLTSFKKWLPERQYIAYNALMEEGSIRAWAGQKGRPIADCYILYADLATEERRPLGLEAAMDNLLGQEKEGDAVKQHMTKNGWTWADIDEFDFAILGRYNAIDAWGAWELYKHFKQIVSDYGDTWGQYYWQYHEQDCLTAVDLQVEARRGGFTVASNRLETAYKDLSDKRDTALFSFTDHKLLKSHIEEFNNKTVQEIVDNEPPQFTKAGKTTARYLKWLDKVKEAKKANHFNTNSTQQLRWLLFDRAGIPPVEYTDKGEPSTSKACLKKMGEIGNLLLSYRGYVTQLKFLTQVREGQKEGIIRPYVKLWATCTTRSGGGKME